MSKFLVFGPVVPKYEIGPLPKPIVRGDLLRYFSKHVRPHETLGQGFYVVTESLPMFKWVDVRQQRYPERGGIASLLLPVGAMLYADEEVFSSLSVGPTRKVRADLAEVFSVNDKFTGEPCERARAYYNPAFEYRPGTVVRPRLQFSFARNSCDSGIHACFNLADAWNFRNK